MPAHTGEKAQETGDFVCKGCDEVVRVRKGQTIPTCECGSTVFVERRNEPGRKSSAKGRLRAPAGEHRTMKKTARRGAAGTRAKKGATTRAKKAPARRKSR